MSVSVHVFDGCRVSWDVGPLCGIVFVVVVWCGDLGAISSGVVLLCMLGRCATGA